MILASFLVSSFLSSGAQANETEGGCGTGQDLLPRKKVGIYLDESTFKHDIELAKKRLSEIGRQTNETR